MFGVSIWFWFWFWLNFVPLSQINLKQNGLFQKKSTAPRTDGVVFQPPLSPGFPEAQDPTSCLDFQDKRPPLLPGFILSLIFDEN